MTVLLVTDLEGVAGADGVAALIEGQPDYLLAQGRLDNEVAAALGGLGDGAVAARDFLLADTHMGGPAPNLRRDRFAPGAQVRLVRGSNPADARFYDGVTAIACLGMHGADGGFVPHGVELAARFENQAGAVSEAQLFLAVAAERGIPAIFVAGDDALGDLGQVPHVVTKQTLSPIRARSRPIEEVLSDIRAAARGVPVPAPPLTGPLFLRFRSRWMADRAQGQGAVRRDETSFELPGATLAQHIAAGCALLPAAEPVAAALRPWQLVEDVEALAARPFRRTPPSEHGGSARRALAAFLAASDAEDDWSRANRALTLHMLQGHAPEFFAEADLGHMFSDALGRLRAVPTDFPLDLGPEEAMARLDAAYVLRMHGQDCPIAVPALTAYSQSIAVRAPLYAWLMGEIGELLGLPTRLPLTGRPFRRSNRVVDLYWLTHVFLLATNYLTRPLPRRAGAPGPAHIEELLLATRFSLAHGQLDLAAELAFCLVVAGEGNAPERTDILAALVAHQGDDGVVADPTIPANADPSTRRRGDQHCTQAALLAFATAR